MARLTFAGTGRPGGRVGGAIVAAAVGAATLLGNAAAAQAQAKWLSYGPDTAYYGIGGDAKRVYVAGRIVNDVNGTFDVVVDAYDGASGAHVWRNQYDSGVDEAAGMWVARPPQDGADLRNDLVKAEGGRVFVGGMVCGYPQFCNPNGYFNDSTLHAFDADTGVLLWHVQNHNPGTADSGTMALEVAGGRVFIGAYGVVYAYDAVSGKELWNVAVDNQVSGLEYRNGRLFVGFDASNFFTPALVQALDPSTGATLWENDDPLPGGAAPVWDIATDKTALYGVGYRAGDTYELRAFDLASGKVLWRYPASNTEVPTYGYGVGVATGIGRVFTAGFTDPTNHPSEGTHFLVRAHSAVNGNLLWQDELQFGQSSAAYSVAYLSGAGRRYLKGDDAPHGGDRLPPGLVVVAGYGLNAFDDGVALLRAYNAVTGALAWEQSLGTSGRNDEFLAMRRIGPKVVAVGTSSKEIGLGWGDPLAQDGIIATYE